MKSLKKLISIPVFLLGVFITYSLYSMGETGDLKCFSILPYIGFAGCIAFCVSLYSHKIAKSSTGCFTLALVLSNIAYCFALLVLSIFSHKHLGDVLMWCTIMVFVMTFYTFPLTALSWVAADLYLRNNEKASQH